MNSTDKCEMCYARSGKWHTVEHNFETKLCKPCVKDLRAHGERVQPCTIDSY